MSFKPQSDTRIALSVLSLIVCHYVYTRWISPRWSIRLPPGPKTFLPIGNVLQIPLEYQQKTFADWAKVYGDLMYARLFQKPFIIVNSLEVARDLMEKRAAKYSDRPGFVLNNEFFHFHSMLNLSVSEKWRQYRKWYQTALESKAMLDSYRPLQRREANRLLQDLVRTPQAFQSHLKRFAGAMMLEIAYGRHVTSADDEYIVFADNTIAGVSESGSLVMSLVDFFPWLKYVPTWFPGGGFKKKALAIGDDVLKMLDDPFQRVRNEMTSGTAKPSFTTFMIEETIASKGQLTPEDEKDIKGSANLMYAAGSDTTITSLTTFVLTMVLHPDVYRKAQEEMDRVIGPGRLPDLDDRESLPYLECVIKEVFRWNPPAPLGVPHLLMESDEYQGYTIPSGSTIIPNIWSMSKAPALYPDPDCFRPERFQEMNSETLSLCDPRKFIFGFGRRICPGRYLADAVVWLVAANIIATMDIRKARDVSGKEISPIPSFKTGVVSHVKQFQCDIRPRSSKIAQKIAQLDLESFI